MDFTNVFPAALLLVTLCLFFSRLRRQGKNVPPSPPAIPLLGHLHLVKKPAHRSLAALSARYGPIMSLRFGSRPVLVVSSATAAEECFSKNDIVFANRPRLLAGKLLGYEYSSLFWSSYGPHWRNLRRIATLELFSTNRLQSFVGVREEEVDAMIKEIAQDGELLKISLRPRLFRVALNMMMRSMCGKRYYGKGAADEQETKRLEEIIQQSFKLSSASNMGDFLPFLRFLGPTGLQKKLAVLLEKRNSFAQSLLDECRSACSNKDGGRKTVLEVMVELQQQDPTCYTDETIKGTIMGLLSAATDTSISTIEWAMAELLSQPEVVAKAREELDSTVGQERQIKESDLTNLPFLGLIIEETLRLHPAAAIIPAHESSGHCTVGGFEVAGGTMLLVNAWAMHRDEGVWEEPEKFKPERFVNVEKRAMMTFGSGRRRCPGEGMAMRVVGLVLGALIHCFEWDLCDGEVDLSEGEGLTAPMAKPLEVMCKPRAFMANFT